MHVGFSLCRVKKKQFPIEKTLRFGAFPISSVDTQATLATGTRIYRGWQDEDPLFFDKQVVSDIFSGNLFKMKFLFALLLFLFVFWRKMVLHCIRSQISMLVQVI